MKTRRTAEMARREEFLAAALSRFAKNGYTGTSTRDICAEIGLVHSAIYNYFPSKEAIVLAIEEREMTALIAGLGGVIDEHRDRPGACLEAVVRFVLDRAIVRREAWRLMADMLRSLKPRNRSIVVQRRDRFESMVRGVLDSAVAAELAPVQDVRLASLHLFGMAEGISGWYRRNGPNSMEELVDEGAAFFLRGFATPQASKPKRAIAKANAAG